jgi:hypothetical protein
MAAEGCRSISGSSSLIFKFMKHCLSILIFTFCSIAVNAQGAYPTSRSAARKPLWLTVELPPNGDYYYYDIGYGTSETYEKALDNAIADIGKKRNLATGQTVVLDTAQITVVNVPLTVKARVEHYYWEYCLDPVQRKYFYYVSILCVVATNPSYDISKVKTNKQYLK